MATATAKYTVPVNPIESVSLTLTQDEAQLVRDLVFATAHNLATRIQHALTAIPELKETRTGFTVFTVGQLPNAAQAQGWGPWFAQSEAWFAQRKA